MNITDDNTWDNIWVKNSLDYVENDDTTFFGLTLFMSASSLLMLTHSFFMNGFHFQQVRLLCDLANVGALFSGICVLIANRYADNKTVVAVFYDFFSNGLFTAFVQFGDVGMFYSRFNAVKGKELKVWQHACIITYIVVLLFLTWMPIYTVAPCCIDVNSDEFTYYYYIILSIQTYAYFAYDAFFTFEFCQIIYKHYKNIQILSGKVIEISWKSLIHMVFSILASVLYLYLPPDKLQYGFLAFNITLTYSLHFLWNRPLKHRKTNRVYSVDQSSVENQSTISHSKSFMNVKGFMDKIITKPSSVVFKPLRIETA